MNKNFLLVGCGNIGRRHLEGLTKLPITKTVHVVEPNIQSQKFAKKQFSKLRKTSFHTKVIWYSSIEELENISELAIIATNSNGRVDIIEQLMIQGHRKFLLEKIVCQSKKEYSLLLKNLKKFNGQAWINTNRRYFKIYKKLKQLFKNEKHIVFSIFSNSLGLGTNTIHYADLFCWMVNQKSIGLDGSLLSSKILSNKRGKNFVEFSGTITGKNKKGIFSVTSNNDAEKNIFIKISSKKHSVILNEVEEFFYDFRTMKKSNFEYEHVSNLTPIIINDILKNRCYLPTAEDVCDIHLELFRIFNLRLEKSLKKSFNLCPIT